MIHLLLLSMFLAQVGDGREIDLWTRGAGAFDRGVVPDAVDAHRIPLELEPTVTATLYDVQLGSTRTYRGISLAAVLAQRDIKRDVDTAMLHFANGMIVPVPLDRGNTVFIAVAVQSLGGGWERGFPEIAKRHAALPDPRPIAFGANKVVISEVDGTFSPWHHVDTLVGIELVSERAYVAQFEPLGSGARAFLDRCQFCHAVSGVGATFGWDFVDPLPVYTYRTPETLHAHVKYANAEALERGYMMPAQRDVEREEIEALWFWLKDVTKDGLRAYRP
jgi:hypothetical protein